MKKETTKKTAEDFLPWAGWFVDPKAEPEVYKRLPGWWQRERALTAAARAAGRVVTLEELEALRQAAETETALRRHIPGNASLATLRAAYHSTASLKDVLRRLKEVVDDAAVLQHCTALGAGSELVRQKPLHGLYAYIWYQALYRRGLIPSLPVTAFLDLEDGIYLALQVWFSSYVDGPESSEISELIAWLDTRVELLHQQVA
jgi:hypothetical protein